MKKGQSLGPPIGRTSGVLQVQNDQNDVILVVSCEGQEDFTVGRGSNHFFQIPKGGFRLRAYREGGRELIRDGTITIDNTVWRAYTWNYDKGGPLLATANPLLHACRRCVGLCYLATWSPDGATLATMKLSRSGALWRNDGNVWSRSKDLPDTRGGLEYVASGSQLVTGGSWGKV